MGSELSRRQAGFTLIEVAVVIAILSVLSVGSVLALRPDGALSDRVQLLRNHADLRAEAVLGARPLALFLGPAGQQREMWQPGAEGGPWVASGDVIPWQDPPRIDTPEQEIRIVFLPDGMATPLHVRLGAPGQRGQDCAAGSWGPLECKPL